MNGRGYERPRALDDPEQAAFAWARYWRIMRWMALLALACVGGTLWILWRRNGALPIPVMIGTAAGIGLTVMLTAALMGLLFLSSGTGHDEEVDDRISQEIEIDD